MNEIPEADASSNSTVVNIPEPTRSQSCSPELVFAASADNVADTPTLPASPTESNKPKRSNSTGGSGAVTLLLI
mgnify:CR=1 FL=1